jgi:hypothetical protein
LRVGGVVGGEGGRGDACWHGGVSWGASNSSSRSAGGWERHRGQDTEATLLLWSDHIGAGRVARLKPHCVDCVGHGAHWSCGGLLLCRACGQQSRGGGGGGRQAAAGGASRGEHAVALQRVQQSSIGGGCLRLPEV